MIVTGEPDKLNWFSLFKTQQVEQVHQINSNDGNTSKYTGKEREHSFKCSLPLQSGPSFLHISSSTSPGRALEVYHTPKGRANPGRKACYNAPQLTIGSAGS